MKIRTIFEPMAIQKKMFFNMFISEKIPDIVYQDEARLGQVIANILGNAVKYTFNGSVSASFDIDETMNMMKIEIKDTGKGIEKLE